MPQDEQAFRIAYAKNQEEPRIHHKEITDDDNVDPLYNKRWLFKSTSHRGVHFFSNLNALDIALKKDQQHQSNEKIIIAKNIEPLLLGKYKFDIGVYVYISSINPLQIYMFDNVLLRLCKLPYPVFSYMKDIFIQNIRHQI